MAKSVVLRRWRALLPLKRLSLPFSHGWAKPVCSVPPACRRERTSWPLRFGMMGLLLASMAWGMACAGIAYQPASSPDQALSASGTSNMCLRSVSRLPTPSVSAVYSGNALTFTATVSGGGSELVETVQFDYARRFQPTQSMVADLLDGKAVITAVVKPGRPYNYTARSHGSAVGAGYYCSEFAEVKKITVPDSARN